MSFPWKIQMTSDIMRLNAAISRPLMALKPPEVLSVSEWADKHRRLSAESSAEVGKWRTSRTPYLKEPMDAFCDPKVDHIVVWAASQVGKSEMLNNMVGYAICVDPSSILFIQPTKTDAEDYSKFRIAPMIRDCKPLRERVAQAKSRDSGNTIRQKSYPGGIITFCGSGEAHDLCSKPIRYVFGDERDRWEKSAGNEGDPWGLAMARQKTFYNSKAVEVSTPTVKGASNIEKAFAEGTMEHWCSKCPHCGEYSEIVFEQIRFKHTETVVGSAKTYDVTDIFYICPNCGGISSENEIKAQEAKWIADNPEAYFKNRTRSFKLTSWVSPWEPWKESIVAYLKAIGDPESMQVVVNTRFGDLWEARGEIESEDTMLKRREDYGSNDDGSPIELPEGVLCLTCGVDTQDDRLEYEVVGYRHFGETWGIKKGIIMGRPDSDEVWNELDTVIDHIYRFKNGKGLIIARTFVDEGGHFTQEVRQKCNERLGKRVFPIKGANRDNIPYTAPPKQQKIVIGGRAIGHCWWYEIGVNSGKHIIMNNLKVETPGKRYCHFPCRDDYGSAYFKSLLSETEVYDSKTKKYTWKKIPGHERNEALDCRNYANAAERTLSPDYDALERRLKGTVSVTVPKQKPKPMKKKTNVNHFNDW